MPQWDPAGSPMNERPCSLVIIPPCTEASVPVNWLTRMKEREANHELHLIRKLSDRDEILKTAFEKLEIEPQFNDDIVATFFSLGFCHFLSELLTRKLRYMSNLDTQNFANRTLDAIKALEDKDQFLYEDQIQKAFDLLCQAKEYFFPAPSKLLDLTCVDFEDLEENLPNMLQHRKRREEKTNLVLPEAVLRYCQDKYPAVLRMLQETVKDQQVTIIGDDKNEPPLYLLSQLRIAEQFVASHRYYQQTLGVTPRVFGRYKAGYTYVLPQLLKLCGFIGSLSETYDGWSLSQKSQSLTRWKGNNGSIIPLLSKKTLNAEDNACFMELPDKI
ncbi:MAG: hypothetical protein IKW74_06730, partial [Thermoguttaceae bacterium]|nr:hypothetical protein [Thermoguttaceae bacterium]